jgi:hypothetical protein
MTVYHLSRFVDNDGKSKFDRKVEFERYSDGVEACVKAWISLPDTKRIVIYEEDPVIKDNLRVISSWNRPKIGSMLVDRNR